MSSRKNVLQLLEAKLMTRLATLSGQDVAQLPIGQGHVERRLGQLIRFTDRTKRPRKPAPYFRADLVRRQKKERPRYG